MVAQVTAKTYAAQAAQLAQRVKATAQQADQTWQERALALAARKRIEHQGIAWRTTDTEYGEATGAPLRITFAVESLSTADGWHTVVYDLATDTARCECRAGAGFHHPCCHAGVAIERGRYVATLYGPGWQKQALYQAWRDAIAEANAAALGF